MLFVSKVFTVKHSQSFSMNGNGKKTVFLLTYRNVHTFFVHSRVTLNYCTIILLQ